MTMETTDAGGGTDEVAAPRSTPMPAPNTGRADDRSKYCSFCGGSESAVDYLAHGPAGIAICSNCVDLIITERAASSAAGAPQVARPRAHHGAAEGRDAEAGDGAGEMVEISEEMKICALDCLGNAGTVIPVMTKALGGSFPANEIQEIAMAFDCAVYMLAGTAKIMDALGFVLTSQARELADMALAFAEDVEGAIVEPSARGAVPEVAFVPLDWEQGSGGEE